MRDTYYIEHRNDGKQDLIKHIIGFTLGDGALSRYGYNKQAQYRIQQLHTHADYILYQAFILSSITKVKLNDIPEHYTKIRHNNRAVYLSTMSHPLYSIVQERMYHYGRKTITLHDAEYIDDQVLAYLIQDDGSFNPDRKRLYIATHSFSEQENKLLRDVIADKLNLHANIGKSNHRSGVKYWLWFNTTQTYNVIQHVLPFVAPSFYYKLGMCPIPQTVTLWLDKYCNDGIVRSLLKDNDYYRDIII